jgi:hypothetical protein
MIPALEQFVGSKDDMMKRVQGHKSGLNFASASFRLFAHPSVHWCYF